MLIKIPLSKFGSLAFIFCSFFKAGYAQVVNDAIEHRIRLALNAPAHSTTIDCTVQWSCVRASLTNRCIQYHNDQWFEFMVPAAGTYYINVSGQHCKDIYGVQALVLEGTPCEVETYRILTCYSMGNQDDIFITLPGLMPGIPYLLNIDGYLHDLCSFDVEVSDQPKGLPVAVEGVAAVNFSLVKNEVLLQWTIDEERAHSVNFFEVWRRGATEPRHRRVGEVALVKNAKGAVTLAYDFKDTLTNYLPNSYYIIGVAGSDRILVANLTVKRELTPIVYPDSSTIQIEITYKRGTPLTVLIFDDVTGRLLQNSNFEYTKEYKNLSFRIGQWAEKGTTRFRVEIIDNKAHAKQVLYYIGNKLRTNTPP